MYLIDAQLASLKAAEKSPDKELDTYTRWAIVKDFVSEQPHATDIATICRKLNIAKHTKLLPGDVQSRNYKGTFFVDLGSTKILPYPRGFCSKFEFDHFYTHCPKRITQSNWLS